MSIKLYNSFTQKKELFKSIKKGQVSMYVCGITPDAATHLGHAFTYISFDVLVRLLRFKGYKVNYVQNVTDIDDDILVRSKKAGRDWREFGEHWTNVSLTNMEKLNWIKPDPYVKATSSIPTIIKIVADLVKKECAYEVDGTVYFEVSKFKNYGKLSGLSHNEMIRLSGERGADPDDPHKRNSLDFIVWQAAKSDEPSWESPWGKGRPGWHIECSSMIYDNLGSNIDIHGGGEDLIFPHHESEIAQSESFTGKSPFAKYFMHTAYVRFKGEKMSKSLGNLVLVSKLLEEYSSNAIRYMILSHHYRQAWEYEDSFIKHAQEAADLIDCAMSIDDDNEELSKEYFENFIEYLEDDLRTPQALEVVIEIANKILDEKNEYLKLKKTLSVCLSLLGFKA